MTSPLRNADFSRDICRWITAAERANRVATNESMTGDTLTPHWPDVAGLFDVEQAAAVDDIVFFLAIAGRFGGPVLELGCGTGRLAIPLARSGISVVAADICANVLRRFRQNLSREPLETRERITLVQADMSALPFRRAFACAICSSNTIFQTGSEVNLRRALNQIALYLGLEGKLVLDVVSVDSELRDALSQYPSHEVPDLLLSDVTGTLMRAHSLRPVTAENGEGMNRFSIDYTYYDEWGHLCNRRSETFLLLTAEELLRLLNSCGLEVVEQYGWYDFRGYSESDRKLLIVAAKQKRWSKWDDGTK